MRDDKDNRAKASKVPRLASALEVRAVVGLGLVLASSNVVTSWNIGIPFLGMKSSLLMLLIGSTVMFAPALLGRFPRAIEALLYKVGPVCLLLGSALLLATWIVREDSVGGWLSPLAYFVVGVGYSAMALRYAQVFISYERFARTASCIAFSYVVCSLAAQAASCLPAEWGDVVVVVLLVLSFFLAPPLGKQLHSNQDMPVWGADRREGALVMLLLFLWVACMVVATLLFSTFIMGLPQNGATGVAVPLAASEASPLLLALFAIVFHVVVTMQVEEPFSIRYQAATLVIMAGFFAITLLSFADMELQGLLAALLWVCRMLCHCLTLVVAIDVARRCGKRPLAVYGVVVAVLHLSVLFMSNFVEAIGTHGVGVLAMTVGYCLVTGSVLLPRIAVNIAFSEEERRVDATTQDERMETLAVEKGLSPRECEVFCQLARGRSIPYIKEQLVVSESTVKTHVARIYKKLEVHSRQELIDMVEAGVSSQSEGSR